jgi:hypothetical protein
VHTHERACTLHFRHHRAQLVTGQFELQQVVRIVEGHQRAVATVAGPPHHFIDVVRVQPQPRPAREWPVHDQMFEPTCRKPFLKHRFGPLGTVEIKPTARTLQGRALHVIRTNAVDEIPVPARAVSRKIAGRYRVDCPLVRVLRTGRESEPCVVQPCCEVCCASIVTNCA